MSDKVWLIQRDYFGCDDGTEEVGYTTDPKIVDRIDTLRAAAIGDLVAVALDEITDLALFKPVEVYTMIAEYDPHLDRWDKRTTIQLVPALEREGEPGAHSLSRAGRLYVSGHNREECRKLLKSEHERLLPELEANPKHDPLVAARNQRRIDGIPTGVVASSLDNVPLKERF